MFNNVSVDDHSPRDLEMSTESSQFKTESLPKHFRDQAVDAFDVNAWRYASPIVLVVGVVGNVLAILVTGRKSFRRTSSGVYLISISVAALGALVIGILPWWMDACGFIVFSKLDQWACRWIKFLYYVTDDVAIWILVAFTFDRFIAVCYPLKKTKVCTIQKAAIVLCSATVLSCAIDLHLFWTRGTQYAKNGDVITNCGYPTPAYRNFEVEIRPWIVFVLFSVLPVLAILVGNFQIVRTLVRVDRSGHQLRQSVRPSYVQTTLMCLSASFAFVVFMVPSIIVYLMKSRYSQTSGYQHAYTVANILVFVHHAINFLLYSMTGRKFRLELATLCGRRRRTGLVPLPSISGSSSSSVRLPMSRANQSVQRKESNASSIA